MDFLKFVNAIFNHYTPEERSSAVRHDDLLHKEKE